MSSSRTATLVVLLVLSMAAPVAVGPAAAEDVTLTVTVIDQSANEVTGVTVAAEWDDGSVSETTRANGQALLDVPAGTEVELDVTGSGYMRNSPYVIDNATASEVTVAVAEQGQARITVTDEDGPVRGATVALESGGETVATEQTGEDGVATSGNVERGSYRLRVSKPGYLEHTERLRVEDVTRADVTIEDAIVTLDAAVQDDHFDPPRDVENATVRIDPLGATLVTLGTGEVSTSLPANRDYEITIAKPGYQNVTRDIAVGETDANLSVNVSRTPAIDLTVANERVVVGQSTLATVTDEYDDPVEGASLAVDDESVAETNAEGQANVRIDAAGNLTISATHEGATDDAAVEGVGDGGGSGGQSDDGNQSTDGGIGPGFGAVLALVAVVLGTVALARRH